MTDEVQERISFLNASPWIQEGKDAREQIGKPPLSAEERAPGSRTQTDLIKLLRPHWDSEIYLHEGLIRNAFDEALTVYQLYELAIENQYLAVNDIKDRVHKELTDLLWSDGARAYLVNYSYTAVIYLAQRVGVKLGFKPVNLPSVRKGSEGRFASFLSQHKVWHEDPLLDGWVGFLDDYQVYCDKKATDKEVFWDFLKTKQRKFKKESVLWAFVAGADQFVTQIADLARTLSEEEKPSYGLFYAYWLSKFYGYDLGDKGYLRDPEQEDWSTAILQSKRIIHRIEQLESGDNPQGLLDGFRDRDLVVRKFWADTIAHVENNPVLPA